MLPKKLLAWGGLLLAMLVPVLVAAFSPYLAWRGPVYIAAGFAGIVGFALMLAQPLLAGGALPGLTRFQGRRFHVWLGAALVLLVILHVAGLYWTSAPDVIDALLFRSPTPFAPWGVVAMGAIFGAAFLVVLRTRIRPRYWRVAHTALVSVAVIGTIVHALLIEGAMEMITKGLLSAAIVAAFIKTVVGLWQGRPKRS